MMSEVERVLILVLDGLRPDLVNRETMPFLCALERQGILLVRYLAAYPPHTRVQVTTMATGCYPGLHGIVSNLMVLDERGEDGLLDTSDFRQIQELDSATNGRAVLRAPLADLLATHGRRLAVAATGSTGSTWLWARTQPFRIVNPRSTFGVPDLAALRAKLGEPPDPNRPSVDLIHYALAAARDLFLPDPEIAVTVVWLHEPDATFHFSGLGSPEAVNTQRVLDQALERFFEDLSARGLLYNLLVFVLSDHGHSTPVHRRSLRELLRAAPPIPVLQHLVPAADFLFRQPGSPLPRGADLVPLVEWLLQQPWVGIVFAHPELATDLPGVLDVGALWGNEVDRAALARLPVLGVSPAWDATPNTFGIPGTVAALTEQVALRSTHGSGSPFDLHAYALLLGPGVRTGAQSMIPAGVIDIVPTIAAALGLDTLGELSGRVLREAFEPDWQPPINGQITRPTSDRYLRGLQVEHTFYLGELSGSQSMEQE